MNTVARFAAGSRAADVARRSTRKAAPKRRDDPVLKSIEGILKTMTAQMTTLVIERADAAERFEERVAEDKAERRELFEKVDGIDTRLVKVEERTGRIPIIEKAVWKQEEARAHAEGAQIFVGKVVKVSRGAWALIGGGLMAGATWLWANWPFK